MYFIDRNKLEQHLLYMDGLLQHFEQNSFTSFQDKLALERLTQMVIESIIDVGNMMIDGFIMRDPGSYEDIIDILVDEKVLPKDEMDQYKEVISLRKKLVREYLNISHEELLDVFKRNQNSLQNFSSRIRTYLNNELGVITAFKNNEEM
jgi:uncharacterized protein YutE (UPF0331/DUF86 family)